MLYTNLLSHTKVVSMQDVQSCHQTNGIYYSSPNYWLCICFLMWYLRPVYSWYAIHKLFFPFFLLLIFKFYSIYLGNSIEEQVATVWTNLEDVFMIFSGLLPFYTAGTAVTWTHKIVISIVTHYRLYLIDINEFILLWTKAEEISMCTFITGQ